MILAFPLIHSTFFSISTKKLNGVTDDNASNPPYTPGASNPNRLYNVTAGTFLLMTVNFNFVGLFCIQSSTASIINFAIPCFRASSRTYTLFTTFVYFLCFCMCIVLLIVDASLVKYHQQSINNTWM